MFDIFTIFPWNLNYFLAFSSFFVPCPNLYCQMRKERMRVWRNSSTLCINVTDLRPAPQFRPSSVSRRRWTRDTYIYLLCSFLPRSKVAQKSIRSVRYGLYIGLCAAEIVYTLNLNELEMNTFYIRGRTTTYYLYCSVFPLHGIIWHISAYYVYSQVVIS